MLSPEDFKAHSRTVTSPGAALRHGGILAQVQSMEKLPQVIAFKAMRWDQQKADECLAYKEH